jgi:hypothetical protein
LVSAATGWDFYRWLLPGTRGAAVPKLNGPARRRTRLRGRVSVVSETIDELERVLEFARARTERAVRALAPKHRGGEMEEFHAAVQAQLEAERNLALARNEPTAVPIAWELPWDTGATLPFVLASDLKTIVLYRIREPTPGWDGSTARMVDPARDDEEPIALVEFQRCYAHRFGAPNDEVIAGHPLYGRGLEAYGAHRVINSPKIDQEKRTNSVHSGFREENWTDRTHYLLLFHDNLFECIARGHKVERLRTTFRRAVELATERLFDP